MKSDKEIIELCIDVCTGAGLKRFASKLKDYIAFPDKENEDKLYKEAIMWIGFKSDLKKRNFTFGNDFSILKGFIISQMKDYNKEGEPVIIINKLDDDTVSFKDNPIKNLYIVYQNEVQRDIDFERLLLARN